MLVDICILSCVVFFFNDTATTEIYTYLHTLSLHDALPIYKIAVFVGSLRAASINLRLARALEKLLPENVKFEYASRSEEHTSELQSLMRISYAVFCLKKKKKNANTQSTKTFNT